MAMSDITPKDYQEESNSLAQLSLSLTTPNSEHTTLESEQSMKSANPLKELSPSPSKLQVPPAELLEELPVESLEELPVESLVESLEPHLMED